MSKFFDRVKRHWYDSPLYWLEEDKDTSDDDVDDDDDGSGDEGKPEPSEPEEVIRA